MRDTIACLVVAASLLVAACLDDPRDLAELDESSAHCEPDAISGASHRDGCTYSTKRSSCNEIQCCRLKTCCVTINGQRICQTTRADCVPVLQEVQP